ncbi:MAG: O-methyltransferase [Bacteroidia bacterium]|nr:O-methyltransferase [Bacteroidia bacterium]
MRSSLDNYLISHSSLPNEALDWLEKQTNIRTNYPRMLSGSVQGELLKMLVEMTGAKRVLEIGSFTGYSAICLASGLPADGHLDALEINDELEDLMREGWEKAGVSDRITLHIGDAVETIKSLEGPFDFVFIDANKRQYCEYFDLVFPKLSPGGVIVADDVLWDGKVYTEPVAHDAQTVGLLNFNDKIKNDPRVEVVVLPLRDGLSIIRSVSR